MSGGSFNYLAECYEWFPRHTDVQDMADYLAEKGYRDEAGETLAVLALMDSAVEKIDTLREVWHAAEWRRSSDIGDESLAGTILKRRGHDCTTAGFHPYQCVDKDFAYGRIPELDTSGWHKSCSLCGATIETRSETT